MLMFDFNCLLVTNSLWTLAFMLKTNDCLTRKRKSLMLNNLTTTILVGFRKNLFKTHRMATKSSITSRKESTQEDRSNSKSKIFRETTKDTKIESKMFKNKRSASCEKYWKWCQEESGYLKKHKGRKIMISVNHHASFENANTCIFYSKKTQHQMW